MKTNDLVAGDHHAKKKQAAWYEVRKATVFFVDDDAIARSCYRQSAIAPSQWAFLLWLTVDRKKWNEFRMCEIVQSRIIN